MPQTHRPRVRLPRGVSQLDRPRGGRGYRASIRQGKAGEVHLGLYETPWLAAFAYAVAAKALRREGGPPTEIPQVDQPTPAQVVAITESVHRRLGLLTKPRREAEVEPGVDDLVTMFEVTVVGFWRAQANDAWDHPGAGLDAAAGQLVAAAELLFWRRGPRDPTPIEVMSRLVGRRLETAFRRSALTRAVLDDDGDDPDRLARWLVHPDNAGGRGRGFRDEILYLYNDLFQTDPNAPLPGWAEVLGVTAPLTLDRIKAAYRRRSRIVHPDMGGLDADFIALQTAYEEAKASFGIGI